MAITVVRAQVEADTDLTDIAALEPTDGDMLYWASGGTRYNRAPSTSYMRGLLNTASAAAFGVVLAALSLTASGGSASDTLANQLNYIIRPEKFSTTAGDGVRGYSGVATAASTTFTDANANFLTADIGKPIVIQNAGAARLKTVSATVGAGGSGYVVGELVTVSGGTGSLSIIFRVDAVSAGAVTAVSVRQRGLYTTMPSSPAATTSNLSGTGLTLNPTTTTVYLPHATTIAGRNSATSITLTVAPTTSVASSAQYVYGSDNTAALQAAIAEAGALSGGAVQLRPRIYCVTNLTMPTNATSSNWMGERNGIHAAGGMAQIVCIGGTYDDDYLIATDRWLTANSNKAFLGSPWEVSRVVFDGSNLVDKTAVFKGFWSIADKCYFTGGLQSDCEATRENQDGTNGAGSSFPSNDFRHCWFKGTGMHQFRSRGVAGSATAAMADCSVTDCQFAGAADYGFVADTMAGWTFSRNRTYSQKIAGAWFKNLSRGHQITANNFDGTDGDVMPAVIVGSIGSYPDGQIGPGNSYYKDLLWDAAADTTTERLIVFGEHFHTDPNDTDDAICIHNNNRSQKTLYIKDCDFEADPMYVRASGNTAGIIRVENCVVADGVTSTTYARITDDPGATTTPNVYFRETDSPAGGDDIDSSEYHSRDSAGNRTQYGAWRFEIGAATDGAEFGRAIWTLIGSGSSADRFTMQTGFYASSLTDPGDGNFNAKTGYYTNDLRVLGARKTGWSTATGSATRTSFDTTTVTTQQLAERVKALIDDLHATAGHGLIGT